jgi:hypothetical protein
MKTKIASLGIIFLLGFSMQLFAEHIEPAKAQKTGKNYYWENARAAKQLAYDEIKLSLFKTVSIQNTAVFYIFNVNENDGFIIVSADNCALPVIGYNTSGSYTGHNVPKPLSSLLSAHAETIIKGISEKLEPQKEVLEEWERFAEFDPQPPRSKAVTPMLSTLWDQGCAFNALCPAISYFDACDHAWAGCAAAAMAQLLKYYQYPATGVGYKYHQDTFPNASSNVMTHYVDFGNTTYQYSNMPDTLGIFDSTQFHIAQLMYHCGVAAAMDYDTTESVAYMENILAGLKNHFNYSGTAKWQWMSDSTSWKSTLKNELDQSRPVFYFGADANDNGHFWICDGYDASDRFHMNWAVFDYDMYNVPTHYNGYFYVSNLLVMPGGPNFSYQQAAILDLAPSSYCAAWSDNPNSSSVAIVNFNNINNMQSKTIPWYSYSNYSAEHSTDVSQFATYELEVITKYTLGPITSSAYCWIDWNQDGVFQNSESTALNWVKDSAHWHGGSPPRYYGIFRSNVTVPGNATLGNTVMRIRVIDINCAQVSSCGASNYGEVEDYGINVQFGTPPPPTALFSPNQSVIYAGNPVLFTNQSIVDWNTMVTASWTFEGGLPQMFNQWNPPHVMFNTFGSHEVKLIATDGHGSDTATGTVNVVPPHWVNFQSPIIHHIHIAFSSTPTVNGKPLKTGDLIGVFYQNNSKSEICGGHIIWDRTANMTLTAFGDDASTPDFKEGFEQGEDFHWKVYSWSDDAEQDVNVIYDQSMPDHDGKFNENGLSAITGFSMPIIHSINILQGWSGVSSFLDPDNSDPDEIFSSVMNELIILQSMNGVYWPSQSLNTIGSWNSHEGYKIKMADDAVVSISGAEVTDNTLTLSAGWHIIPVLSSENVAASAVLGIPEVMIAKEIGNSNVYWPGMSIFTLNVLESGKAYMVYLTAPATIAFPAKSGADGLQNDKGEISGSPWNEVHKTGNSHLIAIPDEVAAGFETGDLIGAFNNEGLLTGLASITETGNVLVVYGDDPLTSEVDGMMEGERIRFRIFSCGNGNINDFAPHFLTSMLNSENYFVTDGISAFTMITGINDFAADTDFEIYPNPARENITIRLNNENAQTLTIEIMNLLGGLVINPVTTNKREQYLNLDHLAEGCYLVKISNGISKSVKKVIINK